MPSGNYNRSVNKRQGSYVLVLFLARPARLIVGRKGEIFFPPGYYLYVGSALSGLRQRIGRHLRKQKKLRWHIDYLLQEAEAVEVWYQLGVERWECRWAEVAATLPQAHPVTGFGAADCSCPSHLTHFPDAPSFELFRGRLGEEGKTIERAAAGTFSRVSTVA